MGVVARYGGGIGMYRIISILVLLTSLTEAVLFAQTAPGDYARSIEVSENAGPATPGRGTVSRTRRQYIIHIPPRYDPSTPTALVIVLHGGGGNAESAIRMTGMSRKADEETFVAVYPQGTGRLKNRLLTWNAGVCCGYAVDHNVDDIQFLAALIDHLSQEYRLDPRRIYLTGFSNGAMMAYRAGCELSEKLAAISPVSGSLLVENCAPGAPPSVVIFHGTADQHVLYGGGEPVEQTDSHYRVDPSVADTAAFWARANSCSPTPSQVQEPGVIEQTFGGCASGTEVSVYTIVGQGHAWPGGEKARPQADKPSQAISATDTMWKFFALHPKREFATPQRKRFGR